MSTRSAFLIAAMLLLFVVGCKERSKREAPGQRTEFSTETSPANVSNKPSDEAILWRDMINLGAAYHWYLSDGAKVPPSCLDDFASRLGRSAYPTLSKRIDDGTFIVLWNAPWPEGAGESEKCVFAYESDADTKGGLILMFGGRVRKVTAEEFGRLPKPQILPEARASDWMRCSSENDECSAEFPGTVDRSTTEVPDGIVLRMTLQRSHGKGFYALNVFRFADESQTDSADKFLDQFRDNHLSIAMRDGTMPSLIDEHSVEQGGIRGREINLAVGKQKVSLNRIFIVGDIVIRANVVANTSLVADPDVKRFFDSVQLKQ